ncbi:MAG: hypothetical protein DRP84_04170 [Spirochaetes bacterium]|nr:MAG: hypothetical protein DRP84_04170 [Spirochaetota bacterium]
MATIKDVAKKANVSIATVSRVINARGKYSKEVEERVLDAAKSLNYTINFRAKGLKTGKTGVIAISIPDYYKIHYPEILTTIVPHLSSKDFHVDLLVNIRLQKIYNYIKEGRYDGLIIISPEQDDRAIHNIIKEKIPTIFAYKEIEREDVSTVSIDFFQAGYLATKHLIRSGHKSIVFVGLDYESYASNEIERGYLFAHDEYGIQYREENILKFDRSEPFNLYMRSLKELIKKSLSFSAVLTTDHLNAYIILKLLYVLGLKIPDDVSVVACGERSKLRYTIPDLTTVILPIEQTAILSSEILVNALLNNDNVVKRIKLMVQISEGKSVLKRLTKI